MELVHSIGGIYIYIYSHDISNTIKTNYVDRKTNSSLAYLSNYLLSPYLILHYLILSLCYYRMKFPMILPTSVPKFKIQIWDKDLLNPNDAICEANLNLRTFYKKAHHNKSDREILAQQWLTMTHPAAQGPMVIYQSISISIYPSIKLSFFRSN